jgi:hypothetical protein
MPAGAHRGAAQRGILPGHQPQACHLHNNIGQRADGQSPSQERQQRGVIADEDADQRGGQCRNAASFGGLCRMQKERRTSHLGCQVCQGHGKLSKQYGQQQASIPDTTCSAWRCRMEEEHRPRRSNTWQGWVRACLSMLNPPA